ncbi:MAG: type I-E CRISPR-associated protein Cas6/Cse3/CasE [Hyphomicrobiaceae bacterium]|nr:type I-E CRISPR-associated protein Cas6/Cse3/CasE [Hyphomicrobiaceae bacterium]
MTSKSPLWMIELRPDVQKATAWMLEQERDIIRPGHDDGYGWHAILAAAFGDLAPKPFRLIEQPKHLRRREYPECSVQLLAYTLANPTKLVDRARLECDPRPYQALAVEELAHKPVPTSFEVGQRLGFEVRVRPTVRQDRDGNRRRSREKDAFLAALDAEPRPRFERPEIKREDVYRNWLTARFGDAARIEPGSFRLEKLSRAMLLRPRQAELGADAADSRRRDLVAVGLLKRGVEGEQGGSPDAVMHGSLTVSDPDAFHRLLARGIGRHRAFGFGMLLLRPLGRR